MSKTIDAANVLSRVLSEDVLTIEGARQEIRRATGFQVDKSTIARWMHRGCGGIKLDAVRVGGRKLVTSRQAVTRFLAARTAKSID